MVTDSDDSQSLRTDTKGIPARETFSAPAFPGQAIEPKRLEQLPWPRNLFGELASIAELMTESEHGGQNFDGACPCGCREEHKHNVSQTLRNPSGRCFDVIYFRSETCKSRWNQERRRRQVGEL